MFASQTMACVLSERLAILHLLADPELQPLLLPDHGDAGQALVVPERARESPAEQPADLRTPLRRPLRCGHLAQTEFP